jgi:hypothetical protein
MGLVACQGCVVEALAVRPEVDGDRALGIGPLRRTLRHGRERCPAERAAQRRRLRRRGKVHGRHGTAGIGAAVRHGFSKLPESD